MHRASCIVHRASIMIALIVSVLVTPLAIQFGKQRQSPGVLKALAVVVTLYQRPLGATRV